MEEAMPVYEGIAGLKKEGDWIQWGGEMLCRDGDFSKMPDGHARFSAVSLPGRDIPEGQFLVTTRRGKQFNSIVFSASDAIQGGKTRNDVFMAPDDAGDLDVREGDRVVLSNEIGSMDGVVRIADLPPRTLQAYWPEANVLIPRRYDPVSEEPDYHALVEVTRA
jgi:anaerobic selenocysteine-containing dehydrogenase